MAEETNLVAGALKVLLAPGREPKAPRATHDHAPSHRGILGG